MARDEKKHRLRRAQEEAPASLMLMIGRAEMLEEQKVGRLLARLVE